LTARLRVRVGVQFLRHLARTRILLHLVEVVPADGSDPLRNLQLIESEVDAYSAALAERPIWIVLSKTDLVSQSVMNTLHNAIRDACPRRRVFAVSSVTSAGLDALVNGVMKEIAGIRERMANDPDYAAAQTALESRIGDDVLRSAIVRSAIVRKVASSSAADVADDDDVMEVIYVRND
jgi:GTP-binding protein